MVTRTWIVPTAPAGLVVVIVPSPVTVKCADVAPNVTFVAPVKFVPLMVTGSPPAISP